MVLYPDRADWRALCSHLRACNFEPCEHLWNWPKGSRHFHWFEHRDFRSFDGVEATVYPTKDAEKKRYPQSTWALHTRTRVWASASDRQQQNSVIRSARRQFGGRFVNDSYGGTNRYIPITLDLRDPVARGIYISYERVREKVSAVRYALPKPQEGLERLVGTDLEALAKADPTRILYNALVPFALAAIEHFFSQAFKTLLKYDKGAQSRLLEHNRRLDIVDVVSIRDGSKTLEDVVASWYSFQSIARIHAAFKEWLDIDFWSILRRRRKIGRRLPLLERKLNQLISFRHGVVHRFDVDLELKREQIEEILDLVMVVIDEFVSHLEKARGTPIRD